MSQPANYDVLLIFSDTSHLSKSSNLVWHQCVAAEWLMYRSAAVLVRGEGAPSWHRVK